MGDAGFRGVSAEQDGRFRNKEKAMLKKLAVPSHFNQKVDMRRVNVDVLKQWISERVEQLLGFEDDVVVEYVNGMLKDAENQHPDPRTMQLRLTGFLEDATATFMSELWTLLLSAQKSIGGIPQEFVEKKKEEMRKARERDAAAIAQSRVLRTNRRDYEDNAVGSGHQGARYYDRGGERSGGTASGIGWGRDRGDYGARRASRWDVAEKDSDRRNRAFIDKSGNRTQRVQDTGWSTERRRSRSPHEQRARNSPPRDIRSSRERSVTPQWHSARRRSSSLTPPLRSRAERSPTYSPQPSRKVPSRF